MEMGLEWVSVTGKAGLEIRYDEVLRLEGE